MRRNEMLEKSIATVDFILWGHFSRSVSIPPALLIESIKYRMFLRLSDWRCSPCFIFSASSAFARAIWRWAFSLSWTTFQFQCFRFDSIGSSKTSAINPERVTTDRPFLNWIVKGRVKDLSKLTLKFFLCFLKIYDAREELAQEFHQDISFW